jgi:protein-S-isoprenylcysteine O-methyltransferase Ste14
MWGDLFVRTSNVRLRGLQLQVTSVTDRKYQRRRGLTAAALFTDRYVHKLELRMPPVVVVTIAGFLMWLAARNVPALGFHFPFQPIVAWVIWLSGFLAAAFGFIEFRRAKTTVNPTKPGSASSLVRTGIYRHTRNPMYFGFLLVLIGCAILVANFAAFLVLPVFIIYMNRFQIEPEERALMAIFGNEFKDYCRAVRRWV